MSPTRVNAATPRLAKRHASRNINNNMIGNGIAWSALSLKFNSRSTGHLISRKNGRKLSAIHCTPCWIQSPTGRPARSSALINMTCSRGARSANASQNLPGFQTAYQPAGVVYDPDRAAAAITAGDIDELGIGGHAGEAAVRPGHRAAARQFDLGCRHGAEDALIGVEHETRSR